MRDCVGRGTWITPSIRPKRISSHAEMPLTKLKPIRLGPKVIWFGHMVICSMINYGSIAWWSKWTMTDIAKFKKHLFTFNYNFCIQSHNTDIIMT